MDEWEDAEHCRSQGQNRGFLRRLLLSFNPVPQLHWCGKEVMQVEANLRTASITLLCDSPGRGDCCNRGQTERNAAICADWTAVNECVCGSGKVQGTSLGPDFRGKGGGICFQCVQKYLSDYCWNMYLLFVHFGSDVNIFQHSFLIYPTYS